MGFGGHINWFADTVAKWNLITSLSQLLSTAISPSRKERKRVETVQQTKQQICWGAQRQKTN